MSNHNSSRAFSHCSSSSFRRPKQRTVNEMMAQQQEQPNEYDPSHDDNIMHQPQKPKSTRPRWLLAIWGTILVVIVVAVVLLLALLLPTRRSSDQSTNGSSVTTFLCGPHIGHVNVQSSKAAAEWTKGAVIEATFAMKHWNCGSYNVLLLDDLWGMPVGRNGDLGAIGSGNETIMGGTELWRYNDNGQVIYNFTYRYQVSDQALYMDFARHDDNKVASVRLTQDSVLLISAAPWNEDEANFFLRELIPVDVPPEVYNIADFVQGHANIAAFVDATLYHGLAYTNATSN